MEAVHVVVAAGLGQNGGGGDGQVFTVAFHNGAEGNVGVGLETIAVDDDEFRAHAELVECPVHGQNGSVENVDLVDFFGCHDTYGPRRRVALDNVAQGVSLSCREFFGVVELWICVVLWEDYGGGKDAACQTATPCLVAAGFGRDVRIVSGE